MAYRTLRRGVESSEVPGLCEMRLADSRENPCYQHGFVLLRCQLFVIPLICVFTGYFRDSVPLRGTYPSPHKKAAALVIESAGFDVCWLCQCLMGSDSEPACPVPPVPPSWTQGLRLSVPPHHHSPLARSRAEVCPILLAQVCSSLPCFPSFLAAPSAMSDGPQSPFQELHFFCDATSRRRRFRRVVVDQGSGRCFLLFQCHT